MDWRAAAAVAGRVASGGRRRAGRAGRCCCSMPARLRAEACGGLANLELGLPFGPTQRCAMPRSASISWPTLLRVREGMPGFDDRLGAHLGCRRRSAR